MKARVFISLAWLSAIHIVAAGAGFFAPYDPLRQNRLLPFEPPMRVHLTGGRPSVCAMTVAAAEGPPRYTEDCAHRYPLALLVKGYGWRIGPLTLETHLFGCADCEFHPLGTDAFGRDQFSRIVYGSRISLLAGVLAALVSLTVGALLGIIAGFYGKYVDDSIMWAAELFLALPWLYALIALRAFLPLDLNPATGDLAMIALIGLVGWARPARLIRGIVLSAKKRDYVRAAWGFGASGVYIMRRHILPQTAAVIGTQAALLVPQYVLAEVTLSFFGLGVAGPDPSWGNMLNAVQHFSVLTNYRWMLFPVVPMALTFFSWMLLAGTLESGGD